MKTLFNFSVLKSRREIVFEMQLSEELSFWDFVLSRKIIIEWNFCNSRRLHEDISALNYRNFDTSILNLSPFFITRTFKTKQITVGIFVKESSSVKILR